MIFLLIGCSDNKSTAQTYQLHFVLSGESEHWEIEGYELQYDEKRYKYGNGTLTMKNTGEYASEHLSMAIQVVMHGEGEEFRIIPYRVAIWILSITKSVR